MTAATAERRVLTVPSFACPTGAYSVEDPDERKYREVFPNLKTASWGATVVSIDVHAGKHVHVYNDQGQVVGYARDGVWHGAVA